MSKFPLTRRQRDIYELLSSGLFDQPPTLDELCATLGLKSRGSMHKHVHGLIDAGIVEPMDHKQRGVRLTARAQASDDPDALPVMGYIAAGEPIEALENPEPILVPPELRTARPCYVLKIRGDSMIEEGIMDGDWVVIEQRDQADNGEIVVALVDEQEATLKRLRKRGRKVLLEPANAALSTLEYPASRVRIQGVLVGQMRSY